MYDKVSVLHDELKKARQERAVKALERQRELGKLSVRERLDLLLDEHTPFLEISPLAAWNMYDGKIHGAGIVGGIGVVKGREFVITANDPASKGGTLYPMGVKKILRLQQIAMDNALPCINLIDSGGAFLPLQSEIFADATHIGRIYYNQAWMSKMGIAQITAVMGSCTAGGAYIPAMSDYVVHVRNTGAIFLGGPPLVKAATGEEVSAEDLGGVDTHCRISGLSDFAADDDADALRIVRQLADLLPRSPQTDLRTRNVRPPLYDPKEIYGIVPPSIAQAYDVREIIARIADASEFLEFKALYGTTLVCGYAYIHGYLVGVLANNGVLFPDSALKATHFIQLCDRDGIPMVFLQNISGFIVGKQYEAAGITKAGHKMVAAVSVARVPKFTVIAGGSFGAGNYAMCGRAYNPRFLWMWPNAQIAVMGGEQAAEVMLSVKNEQCMRRGEPQMLEDEREAMRRELITSIEAESHAYYATARLWDDGIIDPAQTRDILGLSIASSAHQTIAQRTASGILRV
jgi:acetyl-CoA carboxylase carboxyltransferase component